MKQVFHWDRTQRIILLMAMGYSIGFLAGLNSFWDSPLIPSIVVIIIGIFTGFCLLLGKKEKKHEKEN